jgi:hypothetical protein
MGYNVGLQRGRVDANPTRLDRAVFNHMTDQLLVEMANPPFAKSLVELDQRGGIGNRVHQRQMAEIVPRQPLSYLHLDLFVAQPPTKLQIHHAQIDPYGCARSAHAIVKHFFEGLEQLGIPQKLVYSLELFVQLVQTRIDKAIAKTHLLRYRSLVLGVGENPSPLGEALR